jgi:CDP-diacylglycerol--serine O-phosphatidyltransferase
LAAVDGGGGGKYFLGFPIPAAAGMVASLTLFLLAWDEKEFRYGPWRYALPALMVFLSAMMVSEVKYPTFKRINWRTQHAFVKTVIIIVVIAFFVLLWKKVLPWVAPILFGSYLLYGFIRPMISPKMRREIEAQGEEGEDNDDGESGGANDEGGSRSTS